jgi:hypothetical protein
MKKITILGIVLVEIGIFMEVMLIGTTLSNSIYCFGEAELCL